MSIDKVIGNFKRYLKENGLLAPYKRNCLDRSKGILYQECKRYENDDRNVETIKVKCLNFLNLTQGDIDFIERECRMSRILDTSFEWNKSFEGFDFWNEIFSKLRDIEREHEEEEDWFGY